MNREETIQKLEEGKKLPVMTLEDVKYRPKNISEEEFEKYLSDFVKPTGKCWLCNHSLIISWGLVHGIGHCSECGIDVKAYHYFEKDGKRERWEAALQTHPKHYSVGE